MPYQHDVINGFHIATAEMPHMESVSAGFFLPVGSRHERGALNGIAHFAEHMIFKGTPTRDALDLALQIEGVGGAINAFTTEDQTCLETRGPAELLPQFLEVMSDMLWHSTCPADEVERERDVIAEEIVMYQETPGDHLHDLLSESIWTNHTLGKHITGTEASILGIRSEDILKFMQESYRAEGVTLAVAGNIKHVEVCELARKFLPQENTPALPFTSFLHNAISASHIHDQRDIEQTHLALAFHTEGRHSEQRHILRMLSLLMGETMCSRLFQELREKRGLCYHIASDFSLYDDTGTFEIHAGLDAGRLTESIAAIREIITDICTSGFTEAELSQAKAYASGQSRIALETPQAQMSWMGDSIVSFGKIIDPKEARETLESTTLEELLTLSKALFLPENIASASIGPQTTESISLELSKLFAAPTPETALNS